MYIILGLEKNLDSRSLSLINTYESISKSKTIFIKSKNNFLILRFLKVLFTLIRLVIINNRKINGIIVLFKSHLIYPFIFIFSKIIKKVIIVDFGYPFEDNSSYKKIIIKSIYNHIERNFLNARNINLLLESKSQIIRLKKQFNSSNLFCHYMTESNLFKNNSENLFESDSEDNDALENISQTNYILFRGRLNYESGILNIIDLFKEFTANNNKVKLVIQGQGILEKEVTKKLQSISNENIIFINKFISNKNMERLMKNSLGILGQFHNYKNRLNYTIPNKYFESLRLSKIYITPNWDPLKKPYLEKTNLILPSIKGDYNLKQWLVDNTNYLIENKKFIDDEIRSISSQCISWHKSINEATLKRLCKR